jgi:hypothetical protein
MMQNRVEMSQETVGYLTQFSDLDVSSLELSEELVEENLIGMSTEEFLDQATEEPIREYINCFPLSKRTGRFFRKLSFKNNVIQGTDQQIGLFFSFVFTC